MTKVAMIGSILADGWSILEKKNYTLRGCCGYVINNTEDCNY